jgi:hypothetical protein
MPVHEIGDIDVRMTLIAKLEHVAVGSVLDLGRRLPLIREYGFESRPCEGESEAADSCEKFANRSYDVVTRGLFVRTGSMCHAGTDVTATP